MEETKKMFSQKAITLATFFGGPAAAGYLMHRNFQAMEESEKGKKAFFLGVASTIIIFVGIFLLPDHILDMIPNVLIPAIYTGIIYWIIEKEQGEMLTAHKETEGEFHSGWKAAGIGGIFLFILLLFIAAMAFISGDLSRADFDAKAYDKGIAKFTENETKSQAVYDVIELAETEYLIKEFEKNVVLWNENKKIIEELSLIENLPVEFVEQNMILLKYCDLRIKLNQLIVKAISDETDKYDFEMDQIGLEINVLLDELEK